MGKNIPILSWFDKNTIRHLRLPFSFYLMPVFLFAISQSITIQWSTAVLGFVIIHLLLFPSANGYNSYQDRDETSIGALKYPPKVTENLFYATLFMDSAAVTAGLFISVYFSVMLLVFITMSRLYSYRKIRIKKYPIAAFLVVFIFQGGFIYLMSVECIQPRPFTDHFTADSLICMAISSLFIGSMYPLTQIYQHEADKKDGVISLSFKLGYNGTFIFSGILFAIAVVLLFIHLVGRDQLFSLFLFLLFILPVAIRLAKWFNQVKKDVSHASFENAMAINRISSLCMNLYFITMTISHQTGIFK
jgi:1,4-dihydroxy-2-naphthoate octaprenyltransferase